MAADAGILLILAVDHGHGVPADEGFDAALEIAVAGIGHFVVLGNGVAVGRGEFVFGLDAGFAGTLAERLHQVGTLLRAFGDDHLVEGFDPLGDFLLEVLCGGGCGELGGHWEGSGRAGRGFARNVFILYGRARARANAASAEFSRGVRGATD